MAILSFRLNGSTEWPLGWDGGKYRAHTRVGCPSPTAAAHLALNRQTVRPSGECKIRM